MTEAKIIAGYEPGVIGEIIAMHGGYFGEVWNFAPHFECRVATEVAEFAGRLTDRKNGLWTVRWDGSIAGSIVVDSSISQIRWFILRDEIRGRGFGRALLGMALAHARSHKLPPLSFWTFKGLDAAHHLIRSAGFAVAEETNDDRWGPALTHQRFAQKQGSEERRAHLPE